MIFCCGFAALLFIEAVLSLNLTLVDQHFELANLKQELNDLKLSMAAVNSEMSRLNNTLSTKPLSAFTACMRSSPKVLGPHQTLEFDHVIFNEGGAYDPRHGIFRAPVSGVYEFTLIFLNDGAHTAFLEIVKDGVQLAYSYSDSRNFNTGTVHVIIKVTAGQDVWCRNGDTSSKSYLNANGKYSCFSGHLIS